MNWKDFQHIVNQDSKEYWVTDDEIYEYKRDKSFYRQHCLNNPEEIQEELENWDWYDKHLWLLYYCNIFSDEEWKIQILPHLKAKEARKEFIKLKHKLQGYMDEFVKKYPGYEEFLNYLNKDKIPLL